MDAIGYMYRNKEGNQNMLSFQTNELDLATGARSKHLAGREFVISEKFEVDGKTLFTFDKENPGKESIIKTYWEKIYPSLKK